jgi:hypothetical protein
VIAAAARTVDRRLLAFGVESINTSAMIGTGLSASPTPYGMTRPIA